MIKAPIKIRDQGFGLKSGQDRNGWWVNTLVAFPVTLVLSVGMGIFAIGTEFLVDCMPSIGEALEPRDLQS